MKIQRPCPRIQTKVVPGYGGVVARSVPCRSPCSTTCSPGSMVSPDAERAKTLDAGRAKTPEEPIHELHSNKLHSNQLYCKQLHSNQLHSNQLQQLTNTPKTPISLITVFIPNSISIVYLQYNMTHIV